jgi:hypothetical protein
LILSKLKKAMKVYASNHHEFKTKTGDASARGASILGIWPKRVAAGKDKSKDNSLKRTSIITENIQKSSVVQSGDTFVSIPDGSSPNDPQMNPKIDENPIKKKHKHTENIKSAETLAKQIFKCICQKNRQEISIDDFTKLIDSKDERETIFALLDPEGHETLTKDELVFAIKIVYKEKRDLYHSLSDLTQAFGNLNKILTVISALVAAVISLPFFGITMDALLPFTSVLLALSFVFGETAKKAFEAIVFLFVIHPYDIGITNNNFRGPNLFRRW